jgi:hypothetical protein
MNWFMVLLSAVTVVLFLGLRQLDNNAVIEISDFNVSCIDGVEYWYGQAGYKGYIAPRIDSETLDFVTCND